MAEECWSTGDDVDDRVACTANIQRLGPSEETRTKDDLDCLYIDDLFVPTAAPTLAPTLSPVLSFNCKQSEVLVIRIDTDTGYPESYAVLGTYVVWGEGEETTEDHEFGAAYAFFDPDEDDPVLFSSNQGPGMYELALSIAIPDGRWTRPGPPGPVRACRVDLHGPALPPPLIPGDVRHLP
jgi:hypothetical protein